MNAANRPIVSVIVPVYNTAPYLRECLESICRQSFDQIEAIIIDDGSDDGSQYICDSFASKPCFKIIHKKNSGLAAARNTGIDAASGQWILFVDSDDIISDNCVKSLLSCAACSNADIICGDMIRSVDPDEIRRQKGNATCRLYTPDEAIILTLYQNKLNNSLCAKLIRSELLEPGLRFTDGSWYEDLDFFYKLYDKAESIAHYNSPVYLYRDHAGSFINRWSQSRLDVLRVTDGIEKYFLTRGTELLHAAQDRKFSANFNIFALLCKNRISMPDIENECFDCIKSLRWQTITNRHSRFKNKAGALASYGGKPLIRLLSKFFAV